MNDGFGCGCIVLNYGKLIGRIDEHGDSQIDFCGRPTFQRVSGQTKLAVDLSHGQFQAKLPHISNPPAFVTAPA